jgi:HK97 family phage major capsid protein
MDTEQKLKNKIKQILKEQQELLDLADLEDRDLTDAEMRKFENLEARYHKYESDLKFYRANGYEHPDGPIARPPTHDDMPMEFRGGTRYATGYRHTTHDTPEVEKAFDTLLRSGEKGWSSAEFHMMQQRTLQADKDVEGGYATTVNFQNQYIKKLDDLVIFRQLCPTYMIRTGESIGYPTIDQDPENPQWVAELSAGAADDEFRLGKRMFTPHAMALRILISKRLIRISTIDVVAMVRDRLAYKSATVEENAFLNGDGVNSPLGILQTSAHGITASRDRTTAASNISADDLINMVGDLKGPYRRNAVIIGSRSFETTCRKLKSGDGSYLLNASPDRPYRNTLLGFPLYVSEFFPSTLAAGTFACVLFDPDKFWIVDQLGLQIEAMVELYSQQNCNGYHLRKETDAAPIDENGFVRLKIKS